MSLVAQEQFEKVVRSPLGTLASDELKPVALALWHENYVPNLDNLNHESELQKAGYLIDFMSSFNCVDESRQRELMRLTNEIKSTLSELLELSRQCEAEFSEDELAQEWCLKEDATEAVYDLLEYQTRHYVHAA